MNRKFFNFEYLFYQPIYQSKFFCGKTLVFEVTQKIFIFFLTHPCPPLYNPKINKIPQNHAHAKSMGGFGGNWPIWPQPFWSSKNNLFCHQKNCKSHIFHTYWSFGFLTAPMTQIGQITTLLCLKSTMGHFRSQMKLVTSKSKF